MALALRHCGTSPQCL